MEDVELFREKKTFKKSSIKKGLQTCVICDGLFKCKLKTK